jgi:4-hydroxybenzoate polyprenyltransferase
VTVTKAALEKQSIQLKQLNRIGLLFTQLRPKQWTKNLLVFAALLFSYDLINLYTVSRSLLGFLLFSFVSGCVYILNDFIDRDADRLHPVKKYRPIASGALNAYTALSFGAVLLVLSLLTSFSLNPLFFILLLFYFLMNVAYSIKLKQIVIVDVMVIAAGFVLRAIGGGLVLEVQFTPWFLICTMLLSLFLAISKRRHELLLLQRDKGTHRKVLEKYSPELLDQLISIVTTATIISYSLFTFTSGHTIHLMWTIPFVIYGMFRYLYLIHMEDQGGAPEKVLLQDKPIFTTVVMYVASVIVILGYFE